MRPRLDIPRDRLPAVLCRLGPSGAPALQEALGVSRSTLLRLLDERHDSLLAGGQARRRRYALRRALRGETAGLPVLRIDRDGNAHDAGRLALVDPQGSHWWPDARWPLEGGARDGWWSGLPYPLQDLRVQGYMGRQLAQRHHADLGLPADPRDWSDDDQLWALSRAGHDAPGDLIVGEPALRRWQSAGSDGSPIAEPDCGEAYAEMARAAVAAGIPGSSAAGEFPKFTARRTLAGALTPEVIVKFSGAGDSAAVQRWAELLTCEHLALDTLAADPELPVSRSRLLRHGGRTFLESERFDRAGARGRLPVVSLATLQAEVLGLATSDWTRLCEALYALGWLDADDLRRVRRVHWFGRLIANSDMHTGNLSFVPQDGRLRLAPVYDMLPMRHAPLSGGEVPPLAVTELPMPLPAEQADWRAAAALARDFWAHAAGHEALGATLREHAENQATRLAHALA